MKGVRPPTSAARAVRLKEPETITPPNVQDRRFDVARPKRSLFGVVAYVCLYHVMSRIGRPISASSSLPPC